MENARKKVIIRWQIELFQDPKTLPEKYVRINKNIILKQVIKSLFKISLLLNKILI